MPTKEGRQYLAFHDLVDLLIRAGANVNLRRGPIQIADRIGDASTALDDAVNYDHVNVARQLILGGAKVEQRQLYTAIVKSNSELTWLLLIAGADPQARFSPTGRTPLEEARLHARNGSQRVAETIESFLNLRR